MTFACARGGLVAALALAALVLTSCDERDASSLKITLDKFGKGTLVATGLQVPDAPGRIEKGATGGSVAWQGRAALTVSRGTFEKLGELNIGGITFQTAGVNIDPADGATSVAGAPRIIKITLPRGPQAVWPTLLAGASDEERKAARAAVDDPAADDLGKVIKLSITVPGKVVGSAVSLRARKLSADKDAQTAQLFVPLDLAVSEGVALTWHVSWEEQ